MPYLCLFSSVRAHYPPFSGSGQFAQRRHSELHDSPLLPSSWQCPPTGSEFTRRCPLTWDFGAGGRVGRWCRRRTCGHRAPTSATTATHTRSARTLLQPTRLAIGGSRGDGDRLGVWIQDRGHGVVTGWSWGGHGVAMEWTRLQPRPTRTRSIDSGKGASVGLQAPQGSERRTECP